MMHNGTWKVALVSLVGTVYRFKALNNLHAADVVPDSAPNPAFRDLDYGPSTLHDILPLRFRYEDVCSASECLLTAYDLHRANRLAQRPRPRIYMNPVVATSEPFDVALVRFIWLTLNSSI
jgi:hypothetical protein